MEIPGNFVSGETRRLILKEWKPVADAPKTLADAARISRAVARLRSAKRPLVVIGKGAAYSRCEGTALRFIEATGFPFLPTPMGKGVIPDSHSLNASSARSFALKNADVVLVLGARLNWILHFGESPKWSQNVTFIRVDISAEEIHANIPLFSGQEDLGLVGDCDAILHQLLEGYGNNPRPNTAWVSELAEIKTKNEKAAEVKQLAVIPENEPLKYHRVFHLISDTLKQQANHSTDPLVFVSEGANTMDISRSIMTLSKPRQRLDAGTDATMGVGLGYAIAAWEAYCSPTAPISSRKKIVALEGDSAFGFSAMEIETMVRYKMDILVFVMNNGGVYHGERYSSDGQAARDAWKKDARRDQASLPPTALSHETAYHAVAEGLGATGITVRTERELVEAAKIGWNSQGPVVVNVIIETGGGGKLVSAAANKLSSPSIELNIVEIRMARVGKISDEGFQAIELYSSVANEFITSRANPFIPAQ